LTARSIDDLVEKPEKEGEKGIYDFWSRRSHYGVIFAVIPHQQERRRYASMLTGLVQEMRCKTGRKRQNVRFHAPRGPVETGTVDKEVVLIETVADWQARAP
jgi:hypothetical protein